MLIANVERAAAPNGFNSEFQGLHSRVRIGRLQRIERLERWEDSAVLRLFRETDTESLNRNFRNLAELMTAGLQRIYQPDVGRTVYDTPRVSVSFVSVVLDDEELDHEIANEVIRLTLHVTAPVDVLDRVQAHCLLYLEYTWTIFTLYTSKCFGKCGGGS